MNDHLTLFLVLSLFVVACSPPNHLPPNISCIVLSDWEAAVSETPTTTFSDYPQLLELAQNGVYFNNAYTGSEEKELAKKTLLSGLHTGHLLSPKTENISRDQITSLLKQEGYEINIYSDDNTPINTSVPSLNIFYLQTMDQVDNIIKKTRDNDLIVFTSLGNHKNTVPFNLKIPLLFYQKGQILSNIISDQAIMHIDILPTIYGFIKKENLSIKIDGKNFSKILYIPKTESKNRFIYWKSTALNHSLLYNQWFLQQTKEDTKWELYDIKTDSLRKDNVIDYHPGKTEKFKEWIYSD